MFFLKIIKGQISRGEASDINLALLQQEVGGFVERVHIHSALNSRHIVMYVNEDAKLQGAYKNFIWNGMWIAGHAVVVIEKRDGTIINMSKHEAEGLRMLGDELVSLFPDHQGYNRSGPEAG